MPTSQKPKPRLPRAVALGGLLIAPLTAPAAPFLYVSGDLLLALRLSGNATELVVNVGSATNYTAVAPGSSLPLAQLKADQLHRAFPSVNGVSWSVAGASRPPGLGTFPPQTLWVTAPRLDPEVQSPVWLRKGQFLQGNAASRIDVIGLNTAAYSSSQPAGDDNTAAAVTVPSSGDYAVSPILGTEGDLGGTFQGSIADTTPDDFDTAPAAVARLDLYELQPGTSAAGTLDQPGRFLGYFELTPAGTLTFHNPGSLPPAPTITAIHRTGNTTAVSFTTVAGAQYSLRRTDAAGLSNPTSSWASAGSVAGTGAVATVEDSDATGSAFYRVEAR